MNATINRMLRSNEMGKRVVESAIERIHSEIHGKQPDNESRGPGREFSPEAIIKWFFTWTICVVGFMAAMTVLTTLGKLVKFFLPEY